MQKQKLILWGNCQADFLSTVLRQSEDLMARFEIKYYSNFSTPGVFDYESCSTTELQSCDVLIYHRVFTPAFVEAATERLAYLPARCLRIPLPYLKNNLYWPFFNTVATPIGVTTEFPNGRLPYRSHIIDSWIQKGLSDEAIVEAFSALDPAEHLDMDLLERDTYERWRSLEAGAEGKLKFASFLMQNWRGNMLFYIYNHVSRPILLHLANQILAQLDAPELSLRDIAKCESGQNITYAVHPGAARYYGISFAKEGSRYSLAGKHYTFPDFIRFYLSVARTEPPVLLV